MSNYRTDEQQRDVEEAQRWWTACEQKDAEIARQRKEITKLRRKHDAMRKRLADAERKLQPGETAPDMHACERAIRDLTLLQTLREHVWTPRCAEMFREEAEFLDHTNGAERKVEVYRLLALLLSPGDAGRGEGGEHG